MPLDTRIGEMNPRFDGALQQMAEITNLAHQQAMSPYQIAAAKLQNQRSQQALNYSQQMNPLQVQHQQLQNKYIPQQMDTNLARVMATLSGQNLSRQRFLNPGQTMKTVRQGLGPGETDKMISQNPEMYAKLATGALQAAQQGGLPHPSGNQMSPLQSLAYGLLMKHSGGVLPQQQPQQSLQQQAQGQPLQQPLQQLETPLAQQAQGLKDTAESRIVKATTSADSQNRVAAGQRMMQTANSMMPYLKAYASYQGLKGQGKKALDQASSMAGKNIPSLADSQKFESLLPVLKGELMNVLGTPKTREGQKEINEIFDKNKFSGTPEVFMQKFGNLMMLAHKTHTLNQRGLGSQFSSQDSIVPDATPSADDILSSFRGKK